MLSISLGPFYHKRIVASQHIVFLNSVYVYSYCKNVDFCFLFPMLDSPSDPLRISSTLLEVEIFNRQKKR